MASRIRLTPHIGVAAGILLIALIIAVGPLGDGGGHHPRPIVDLKITGLGSDAEILPASAAMAPLSIAHAGKPESNPFVLRDKTVAHRARIPFPPPPPLTPPEPAVMPLPAQEGQP
jgi:hypothetical protein